MHGGMESLMDGTGLDVVKKIESNKTDGDDAPIAKVVIAKSGQL